VQALVDNLIDRGLDPKVCRLFIVDGAKALSKVIRRTFGAPTPIQRCQIHKARNVKERLPQPLHASSAEGCDRPGSTAFDKKCQCCRRGRQLRRGHFLLVDLRHLSQRT
jgi:transposase-like protein